MRLFVDDKLRNKNIALLLRSAGYRQDVNRRTGAVSYARSAGGGDFPRFHLYLDEADGGWMLNLHIDQKAPSYRGTSAHAGEYEGEIVEREMERLRPFVLR